MKRVTCNTFTATSTHVIGPSMKEALDKAGLLIEVKDKDGNEFLTIDEGQLSKLGKKG